MEPDGRLPRLAGYGRLLLRGVPLPATRFIIFGSGRCGSTLLVDLLDTHPSIICESEVLLGDPRFPRLHLDYRAFASRRVPTYGAKVLAYQLEENPHVRSPRSFIAGLAASHWRIIHLRRHDLLRLALSNINARRFAFHQRRGDAAQSYPRTSVDPAQLLEWMRGLSAAAEEERIVMQGVPHLAISYEEDLESDRHHQRTADHVFNWLEIPEAPVTTDLIKMTPTDLHQAVSNLEEVCDVLSGSEFSDYATRLRAERAVEL